MDEPDATDDGDIDTTRCYLNSFQNIAPTLRWRPDFDHGIPVARDTLRFAFVIPTARFQLKPPLFIDKLSFRARAEPHGNHLFCLYQAP